MIPILFEKNSTNFTTNGMGRLSDAITCTVTEERNGSYELYMEYPEGGIHEKELETDRIIYARPAVFSSDQPFRIYKITKPLNKRFKVYARHISYDLAYISVMPFGTALSATQALQKMVQYAERMGSFSLGSITVSAAGTFVADVPASFRNMIGGKKGSILDTFGGELEWDGFKIKLLASRGTNRGLTLRYGKNISDISQGKNIDYTVTGITPYYKDGNDKVLTLPEKSVYKSGVSYSTPTRTQILDCGSLIDEQSIRETNPEDTEEQIETRLISAMRTAAQSYANANLSGVPDSTIEVSFVDLGATEEYKDNSALFTQAGICDTVGVYYERLGISVNAKIIKTEYNVLLERFNKLTIGKPKSNLSGKLNDTAKAASDIAAGTQGLVSAVREISSLDALQKALQAQIAAQGYAAAQDATNLNAAKGYADQQDAANLDASKSYTNSKASSTLSSANSYADAKAASALSTAKGYTDTQITTNVNIVKQYADQQAAAAVNTAAQNAAAAIAANSDLITGVDGGYVLINRDVNDKPFEILIMDNPDVSRARKIWRWNQNGLGYSSTGYNGTYKTALSAAGIFNTEFIAANTLSGQTIQAGTLDAGKITTGTLTAALIKTGVLQDAAGINLINMLTGEFSLANGNFFYSVGADYIQLTNKLSIRLAGIPLAGNPFFWYYSADAPSADNGVYYGTRKVAANKITAINDSGAAGQIGPNLNSEVKPKITTLSMVVVQHPYSTTIIGKVRYNNTAPLNFVGNIPPAAVDAPDIGIAVVASYADSASAKYSLALRTYQIGANAYSGTQSWKNGVINTDTAHSVAVPKNKDFVFTITYPSLEIPYDKFLSGQYDKTVRYFGD